MMKFSAFAMLGFAGVSATETGVNPIRKVVTLMQEMQKEVEAEGEAEKVSFLLSNWSCFIRRGYKRTFSFSVHSYNYINYVLLSIICETIQVYPNYEK